MNEALRIVAIVIGTVLIFTLLGIVAKWGNLIEWYWRIRFRRTFGEWPTYNTHLYRLMQKDVVDGELALLATRLHKTNEAKDQLLDQISSTAKGRAYHFKYGEAKVKLAGHERRTRDALKKFEKARMLAKTCGFSIHDDYRKYLCLNRPTSKSIPPSGGGISSN